MDRYWIFVVGMSSRSSLGLKMESREIKSWHCVSVAVVVVRRLVYSGVPGSKASRLSRDDLEVLKRVDREASDLVSVILAN